MTDRFGALSRITLLRHTLIALVAFAFVYLLIANVSDFTSIKFTQIAFVACAAAGLTLLIGQSGQISLGHGAFMMIGGYTLALLLEHWAPTSHGNLVLIVVIAASAVVSALFGAVVGLAAARLRGPYLAGATLALAIGLPAVPSYEKFAGQLGASHGVSVTPPNPPNSTFDTYKWQAFVCCVAAIVVFWFVANVMRSRLGRMMRAVRDDEVAASLCGLSVARVQVTAFIISAACAGVGGALLALFAGNASPSGFTVQLSLTLLAAVVFGGLGTLSGALIGAILVQMLSNYWAHDIADALQISSTKVTNNLPLLVYGVLLAVVMLASPAGVVGTAVRGARAGLGRVRQRGR